MTLTVEDGSIVADANSYATLVEARAYAESRGVQLSAYDDVLEQELLRAMDYLESLRGRYHSYKTDSAQSLQWPRSKAYIDGFMIDSDSVPKELKHAQIELAMAIEDGYDPLPVRSSDAFVVREKVGPIETTYSEKIATSGRPVLRKVDALLAPLLKGGFGVIVVRA